MVMADSSVEFAESSSLEVSDSVKEVEGPALLLLWAIGGLLTGISRRCNVAISISLFFLEV